MKVRSLEVFVCPVCHGRFRLRWQGSGPEIMEGGLTCLTCGASYPITRGIPRFVSGEAYAQSFATAWRWRWRDTFDWYTPTHQSKYLYPEIFRWFKENGFTVVDILDGPIRMCGVKNQEHASGYGRRHPDLVAS